MDAICRNCGGHSTNGILVHTPKCRNQTEMAQLLSLGDTTYAMDCSCSNCFFKGNVEIKKGTPLSSKGCPACGCATLKGVRYRL